MMKIKKYLHRAFYLYSSLVPFSVAKGTERLFYKLTGKSGYRFPYKNRAYRGKPKYIVFRYTLPDQAILSVAINYVPNYHFARENGIIPLMDMEYEQVFADGKIDVHNAWTWVFEQPISVKKAVEKRDVYIDKLSGATSRSYRAVRLTDPKQAINPRIITTGVNWRQYYADIHRMIGKCWRFKPEITDWVDKFYRENLSGYRNVLGVMLREVFSSDFSKTLNSKERKVYEQHPLNPNVEEILEIVKEYKEKWNCEKVFISTIFEDSVELFTKHLGADVCVIPRIRERFGEERKNNFTDENAMKKFYESFLSDTNALKTRTIEYIYDVLLLSRCDYFIASNCSGSAVALSLNGGKYKDICVLEDKRKIENY